MSINYRPEIDGLRAIAVVAVILYHAQITIFGHQPFRGGFIGVDIFFVISGYLITSIILKEIFRTGTFSFKYFYERRVRRLLPALLLVMLVTFPFAWMYLLPSAFIDFSKSIIYSLGFSSNLYFHFSGQEYGAENGLLKPFLHTWSLSVEEQYYILFPICLLLTYKFFKEYLIYILVISFFISIGLADWGSRKYVSATFYFLHTRMWELLLGSILAYFEINLGTRSQNKTCNLIMPFIGLLLIGHSILFFNDKIPHPSFYTLSPVIGVCLIIWFSNKNELVTKILSSKLFVGIGLISYSLYLWHYPIFAFYRINSDYLLNFFSLLNFEFMNFEQVHIINKIYLILILISFSLFSYFFVEKKFRDKKISFRYLITIMICCIILILGFSFLVIKKNGFINRLPEIMEKKHFQFYPPPWKLLKNSKNEICFYEQTLCKFNLKSNKKIYLIGDSHMASISYNLKDRITNLNYQFIVQSVSSKCMLINDSNNCENKDLIITDQKFINENSIFILGGNTNDIIKKLNDYEKNLFIKNLNKLSKNNKIILIYPIPTSKIDIPSNLFKILLKKKNLEVKDYITISYSEFKKENKYTFDLYDSIKNEDLYRVYPHRLFCNTKITNKCLTHDNNDIYYSDTNHPSLKGAEMINNLIIREINKIN